MSVTNAITAAPAGAEHRSALISAHIAAMLFGLTGIFGALINSDATLITSGRAVFACIALLALATLQKRSLVKGMNARATFVACCSGLLLAAHWVTFFIAIKVGGVAVATLGFASFPAFIALVDRCIYGERLKAADLTQLGLVSLGLVLVVPAFDFADEGTLGLAWGLASGAAFALLSVMNRRYGQSIPAAQVAFWQNVVVAVVMAPFVATPGQWHALRPNDWVFLALLGVFCTGLSQYLFVKSLEGLPARNAGMIIALEPVYAIACAWWLFHIQPTFSMLAGAALVVLASVLAASLPEASKTATTST